MKFGSISVVFMDVNDVFFLYDDVFFLCLWMLMMFGIRMNDPNEN